MLSVSTVLTFAKWNTVTDEVRLDNLKLFKKFHIVGSLTTAQGCHMSYDLWLDVSIIPLRFNSLTGTITTSGNCAGVQSINVTSLRGTIEENTKETSDFKIDDQIFSNSLDQAHFEKVLQKQINLQKNQVWDAQP